MKKKKMKIKIKRGNNPKVNITIQSLQGPPDSHSSTCSQLRDFLKLHDLCLVKADNGEASIVIPRADYNKKMFDFLHSANAKAERYPFTQHNKDVRAVLESPTLVFGEHGKAL